MPATPLFPPRDSRALASARLLEGAQVLRESADACAEALARAAELVGDALAAGHRVLVFGNGGSASQALHLAAELTGRFARERAPLPALALGASGPELTALANDYGFERAYARLVEAHGRPGDAVVAFSTSGDSENVVAGVREARTRGLRTVGLSGRGGGKLASLVDVAIVIPSDVTPRIQEAHLALAHALCEIVEERFGDSPSA